MTDYDSSPVELSARCDAMDETDIPVDELTAEDIS